MMQNWHDSVRLLRGPALIWLVLLMLLAVMCGTSFLSLGAYTTPLILLIAAIMIGTLATFLMDLRWSSTLRRLAASAGLLWLVFMFLLTFSDYFSRA